MRERQGVAQREHLGRRVGQHGIQARRRSQTPRPAETACSNYPTQSATETAQCVECGLLPIRSDGDVDLDADLEWRAVRVGASAGRAKTLVHGVDEAPCGRVEAGDVEQRRVGLEREA